jgi:thiamine biosynthesis lipoprotein
VLHRAACFAMGTRFELVLEGRDDVHGRAAAEEAVERIVECDGRLSRFRSDSLVSRINREAGSAWVALDAETFELLERCARACGATEGAFDLCLGAAMDRLRAGQGLLAPAGAFALDPARRAVRFTAPGTALDLGAVAKGFALDRAAELLRAAGIERALLHGGTSSVLALGAPPDRPEGWPVGLGPEFAERVVSLRDRALSISAVRGSRGPAGDAAARGQVHVLDPREGRRLRAQGRAAVLAASAEEAEIASTALLVLVDRGARPAEALDAGFPSARLECIVVADRPVAGRGSGLSGGAALEIVHHVPPASR